MKYPQPDPGEDKKDAFLNAKAAEKAFIQFIRQLAQKQAKGFISEGGEGKIFSFETWLRETGQAAAEITGYCQYAKEANLLEKVAQKGRKFGIYFEKGFFKGLLFLIGILLVPVLLIYLLAATLLLIFNVSLWNGSAFLSFITIGVVLMLIYLFLKPGQKARAKKGQTKAAPQPVYVIKYFDNDELTFAKAKSRLFVE